jgi:ankyrin repeat protein
MNKLISIMICTLVIFSVQTAVAQETVKWPNKQIEELSKKFFQYSTVDGKQSLTLTTEPNEDWWKTAIGAHCDNTLVKLTRPRAVLSIPGTSLILAFLECPAERGYQYDSIVAFFDRDNVSTPLHFSRLYLMDEETQNYYYYGQILSLEARQNEEKCLHVVVTLGGGDGGDHWTSFVILHIDMTCRITTLSKLYSSYTDHIESHCGKECGGTDMSYRFVDNKTVEVTTKDIIFSDSDGEQIVKTTRKNYDLLELYKDPRARVFPSKAEKAAALLNSNADVNKRDKDGVTPLMWTAGEGSTSVVKDLIDKGADVKAKDNQGRTPVMSAAYKGFVEVVKLLLEKGADINAKDKNGWTALMFAASGENLKIIAIAKSKAVVKYGNTGGTIDVINMLIEKGLDVNAGDKDGYTPLVTAAYVGHVAVVKLLIEKGADIDAKTQNGKTALSVAQAKGHADVVTFLKTHGAKE